MVRQRQNSIRSLGEIGDTEIQSKIVNLKSLAHAAGWDFPKSSPSGTSAESQLSTKKGEPAALKPVFAGGNRTEFGVTLKNGSLYFMSKTYLSTSSVIPKGETRLLHTHDRSESLASERSILARLILQDDFESEDPFDELRGLAETAGTTVMATIFQKREHPDQTTYLGKGKVQELKGLIEMHDADVVVFDNDLNPAQTRNLEKALNTKVLDRTELILDIFASNAQTHESRLAVELAQLEYSLPRLKRMWTHLSRQTMGVGMRGPGEKQLEVDRRLAEKRVHDLKQELAKVERRKEREVASRRGMYSVSLAGYTNAGKSTLMNALTDAGVEAVDKLFATLDTRTRRWMLPGWGPVLLSDTVGFIRDLPHRLIASFRATLEETRQADLLLHVADASNPNVLQQISSVYKVLKEIGIEEKDTLLVLNKVDREGAPERAEMIKARYPNAIGISAKSGLGLQQFGLAVSDALTKHFAELEVRLPLDDGKTQAWLSHNAEIISKQYNDDHALVHCRMPTSMAGKLASQGFDVRVIAGKLPISAEHRNPDRATFLPADDASNTATPEAGVGEVA